MINFTSLGFKEIIEHKFERKQLALLVTLDFYYRTNKKVLKKQICKESSIVPESFSRAIKRLKQHHLLGDFAYNEQAKRVSNSFKLINKQSLHVQVPTYLLKIGALTNNALAVLGYLKAMPKGEWNGSCYKLHHKINVWFKKHHINLSVSLTTIYQAIKILKALKLVDKVETKRLNDKKWMWIIKINVNQKNLKQTIPIQKIIATLQQLTIKPFMIMANQLEAQEFWNILD